MKPFQFNQRPTEVLKLDPDYVPMILGDNAYEKAVTDSKNPSLIKIALERSNKQISTLECYVFSDEYKQEDSNFIYIERKIKTLIWQKGGFRVIIGGHQALGENIQKAYQVGGIRFFDAEFMANVYEHPFEVNIVNSNQVPTCNEVSKPIGRQLNGCRIGFDAGGSDRKVSAVVDGKSIYSEEIVWFPKTNSDWNYHYNGIMDSLKRATSKLPRVDAIGISSAGIFIDNRVAVSSLFREIPKEIFDKEIRKMYFKIKKEYHDIPLEVMNDGDVTALAGSMSLQSNQVLGIAMGTSEAAGYVDIDGNITGWLNELAFVPVDYNPKSIIDEWSQDYGVGVNYFSQDAVIKLANSAGITFDEAMSPAEKLQFVQSLAEQNDKRAIEIFKTIGVYLGYGLAYYAKLYDIQNVLLLGRVTSGIGGTKILEKANSIIKSEFPKLRKTIRISLPDEKNRRVGQSIAAASLPII